MILLLISTLALATLVVLLLFNQQVAKFSISLLAFGVSIFDTITLPIHFLIDKPWRIRLASKTCFVEQRQEANNNYTFWQRKEEDTRTSNTQTQNDASPKEISEEHRQLRRLVREARHVSDLLQITRKLQIGKTCLGRRRIKRTKVGDQVTFEPSEGYEWLDYAEVLERIESLMKVLHQQFQLKRGDRVLMIVGCCQEWLTTFVALQSLGCEVVILRYTPDLKPISYIVNLNQTEIVFTSANLVRVLNELKPTIPTVTKLVYFLNPYEEPLSEEEIATSKYELFEYDQLLASGRKLPENEFNNNLELSPDDIAITIFTSGSTGLPKGVLIPHRCIVEGVRRYLNRLVIDCALNNRDTFLAYIESHTMEVVLELLCFVSGVKIAYGSPGTALSGSPRLAKGCIGDLATSKTSFWIAMPQLLEQVRSSIEASLRNDSTYQAALYDFAFEYRHKWSQRGYRCRLTDSLLFNRIKSRYSGQLKVIFTGGAPLRKATAVFIKHYLNTKLLNVYASTESIAMSMGVYDQFDDEFTTVLHDGVKLRLEDWPEGGYSASDQPNPRGEIVVGEALSVGYFKNPEETEKAYLVEDGIRWWRTGDIGELNEYNQLSIIDRKKDLVKLQTGKYIALGKSEAILKACKYVENLVIHANSYCDYLTAIVLPNAANIRKLAESMQKSTKRLEDLYEDTDIRRAVVDELNRLGTENFLLPIEVPQKVKLVTEQWTPQNGFLTELMKIRRRPIYDFYKESLEAMYAGV